jgi:hypothetical protein
MRLCIKNERDGDVGTGQGNVLTTNAGYESLLALVGVSSKEPRLPTMIPGLRDERPYVRSRAVKN